jgi:hypothetical protein
MLKPEQLKTEECYFQVLYCDRSSTLPLIKTLIYIGKNLDGYHAPGTKDEWFFQDLQSYVQHGNFLSLPENIEREVYVHDQDAVSGMFDFDGLIKKLYELKNITR